LQKADPQNIYKSWQLRDTCNFSNLWP